MYQSTTPDGRASVKMVKGLMSFASLKKALQERRTEYATEDQKAKVDIALHFRIASAGGQSARLTHPFHAGDDVMLMHNGHISQLAYDSADLNKLLPGASHKPSLGEQQTLSTFKEEKEEEVMPRRWQERLGDLLRSGKITGEQAQRFVNLYVEDENDALKLTPIGDARLRKYERAFVAGPKPVEPPRPSKPDESDTSRLAQILSRLPRGWQRNDVCHFFIREQFLKGDRVVLFDAKGLAVILGEKSGVLYNDVWYSNDYWIPRANVGPRIVSGKDMLNESGKEDGGSATPSHRQPKLGCTLQASSGSAYHGADSQTRGAAGDAAEGVSAPSLPPGMSSEDDEAWRQIPDDTPSLDWGDAWNRA